MAEFDKVKKAIEKTKEQEKLSKNLTDTFYVRLTNQTYRTLYKVAKQNNTTMSEVGRLCIESQLMNVDSLLKEIARIKREFGTE